LSRDVRRLPHVAHNLLSPPAYALAMIGQAIRIAPPLRLMPPRLLWPALLLVVIVTALAIGWVGYSASDDAAYHAAALEWLHHAPFPGHDHWGTRFPLVLTLAAMIGVVGDGALAMNMTAVLWYAAFLFAVHGLASRIGGARTGWLAAMLAGTMPVVIANATTVSCDLTEAVFLLLGIRLIGDAAVERDRPWLPIGAGLAFGAAILCRETTSLALFGFAPLFLIGRPVSRRALLVMGLSCAALLAGEALFQYVLTGDPLHRWTLAFHHDSHIDRAANLEGNFLVHPAIDPLLVLLVNDDFALLFWLAAAAVAMRFDRSLDAAARARMIILALLALSAFLLVGALYTKLVLNPRYFVLPAIAAAIVVAVWLDSLRPTLRAAILALALTANLLMLSVEDAHPRWPAEALVQAGRDHRGQPIVTSPETLHRALLPIGWNGLTGITAGPPAPGRFYVSTEAERPANAIVLARYPAPPTMLGRALAATGLASAIPQPIARRLLAPDPTMVLSRPERPPA
jgi:4-amino-4-deoxy-L-arabinose transferase-like glycosyltransferase